MLAKLSRLLGAGYYDHEHHCLIIHRRDLDRLISGQIFGIEVYLWPDRPPQLHLDYVATAKGTSGTFRGTGLRPLTLAGLSKTIKLARMLRHAR